MPTPGGLCLHTLKIDVGAVAGRCRAPARRDRCMARYRQWARALLFATLQQTDEDLDPAMSLWLSHRPTDALRVGTRCRASRSKMGESFALACRDLQGLGTFLRLLTVHEKQHLWHTSRAFTVSARPALTQRATFGRCTWSPNHPRLFWGRFGMLRVRTVSRQPGSAQRSAALVGHGVLLHADVVVSLREHGDARDRPPVQLTSQRRPTAPSFVHQHHQQS